jgi:hypothetical protein
VVAAGADFMKLGVSNCIQLGMLEQAARLIPQAAIATTRFMTNTIHSLGPNGPLYKSLNRDGEASVPAMHPHRPSAGYNFPRPVWADYSKLRLNLWLFCRTFRPVTGSYPAAPARKRRPPVR